MPVGDIIVDDGLDRRSFRYLSLHGIEEADELLMPVLRHTAAGDLSFHDIEGGEQSCRAVAFVIVSHGAGVVRHRVNAVLKPSGQNERTGIEAFSPRETAVRP